MHKPTEGRTSSLLVFSGLLAAVPALAQQPDTVAVQTLGQVVVTAARSEVQRNKTPQSITVITRKDLEATGGSEFTNLLKKNTALNIVQYPGLLAGVGIRGFRPQTGGLNQRVLLLVDGRPAGTANLATINPSDIERIEVLKGPASAQYGSQAMGGVVNVITRQSAGAIRSHLSAEYGSFQTFKGSFTSGGNISDKLSFDLAVTTFDRNKNTKLGKGNLFRDLMNAGSATKIYSTGAQQTDDQRSDGLRREYTRQAYTTGSARIAYRFAPGWTVQAKGERFVARNVESPSDLFFGNAQPGTKDIERHNGEVSLAGKIARHALSLRGYGAREQNDNNTLVSGGSLVVPYLSFQSTAEWKGVQLKDVLQWGRQELVFGLDHNRASTRSRSYNPNRTERAPFSPNYSLVSTAAYVQGQLHFLDDKLVVNPGLRYDYITYDVRKTPLLHTYAPGKESNPFLSPSLSAQYQLPADVTVHATVGRAFVTPDAYNVAGYSEIVTGGKANVTQGNPALKNENSISWDAGLRYQREQSGLAADLTWFQADVQDRITSQRTTPPAGEKTPSGYDISSRTTYINANKATIRGLEAELSFDFGALRHNRYSLRSFVNATRTLKAEEITTGTTQTKRDIYNVAHFTASYGLEYNNLQGLNARLAGRYVGHRKDTDFNDPAFPEIVYPEFMVVDAHVSYTYARKHTIGLFVNNLTDENYYEKRGFNLEGRNLSVRYALSF